MISARKSVQIDLTEDSRQDLKSFPTFLWDFPDVFRRVGDGGTRLIWVLSPHLRPKADPVHPISGMLKG